MTGRGALIAVLGALCSLGCDFATPKIYSADPITAWVVDADTGKPVEGANVLAVWEMKYGLENHGTNYAMVLEAVTDSDGRFSLPGWGPKLVVKAGAITTAAPRLVILKADYRPAGAASGSFFDRLPSHMASDLNGKIFKLEKFVGAKREYAEDLHQFVQRSVESLIYNGCNYTAFPRFLLSLDRLARDIQTEFANSPLRTLQQTSDAYLDRCGPAPRSDEETKR